MIDRAHEDATLAERLRIVEEMAQSEIEDVPDIEELERQFESTYGEPDLY